MPTERTRIVVTGAGGQLGARVASAFSNAGHDVVALTRGDLDVTDDARTRQRLRDLAAAVVVNCTAYNAVDGAEDDEATAFAVNAIGAGSLAAAAAVVGARLIHYSTDFVFDGRGSSPYTEEDAPNPLNAYGRSKLAGEEEVRRENGRHYILRVESLFGGSARAGVRTTIDFLVEKLAAGRIVKAAVDRTVSPSYVPDVVAATLALVDKGAPFGTYHCVASGHASWYELAQEVAGSIGALPLVVPVSAGELSSRAVRPRFCALANDKLRREGIVMPAWQAALHAHLTGHHALRQVAWPQPASQVAWNATS